MPDLLVKLYDLPKVRPNAPPDILVHPVMPIESARLKKWIAATFSQNWSNEFDYGAKQRPVSAFVAMKGQVPVGFACYDVAALGLFGPMGVDPAARCRGIGAALLFATLDAMLAKGYAYAIIGWVGPEEFYQKLLGAELIEGSTQRYQQSVV